MKKGPKRVKKAQASVVELDQEMEDYRANADTVTFSGKTDGV